MAKESLEKVAETAKEIRSDDYDAEAKMEWTKHTAESTETVGEMLIPVGAVYYCGTCHKQEFCTACHGTPMPHSEEFKEPEDVKDPKGHPVQSKVIPKKCVMCHGVNEQDPLLRRVPPRHEGRLRVRRQAAVGQPAPEGRRQVRREVVHREVPLAEVLRRLPHQQEGRARVAQAAHVDPSR